MSESNTVSGTAADKRSKWGRVKFGAGRIPAMAIALPLGIAFAIGSGLVFAYNFSASSLHPLLVAGIFALMVSPAWTLLIWALIIDRMTLQGALERPEESVESRWYATAAQGAFHDTITVTGLALAALAITGTRIDAVFALSGVILLAALSTAIRYLVARTRG